MSSTIQTMIAWIWLVLMICKNIRNQVSNLLSNSICVSRYKKIEDIISKYAMLVSGANHIVRWLTVLYRLPSHKHITFKKYTLPNFQSILGVIYLVPIVFTSSRKRSGELCVREYLHAPSTDFIVFGIDRLNNQFHILNIPKNINLKVSLGRWIKWSL